MATALLIIAGIAWGLVLAIFVSALNNLNHERDEFTRTMGELRTRSLPQSLQPPLTTVSSFLTHSPLTTVHSFLTASGALCVIVCGLTGELNTMMARQNLPHNMRQRLREYFLQSRHVRAPYEHP